MGAEPLVLVERDGAIATITINRPARRNAVTVELCVALFEAVRSVAQSDARVAVLRGAGDDFCVGADLKGAGEPSPPATLETLGPVYHAATLLHEMPQVTIAAIDGGCAGAGMGWACACDLRFASTRAKFATAFLAVGVPGDMGLGWTLPRIVGGARARELLLFPDKVGADEALAMGLVTRLLAPGELHDRTAELARSLCARDSQALRLIKANLVSGEQTGLRDYIEIESARHLHVTNRPGFGSGFGKKP
jgi:2-(1,2-epoxy-1,2-dihydrophenyl)acetyl-CoA isomerase